MSKGYLLPWCCNSPRTLNAPARNDLWGIESAGDAYYDASIYNTSLQYGFVDHAMCLIWEIHYLNVWSCCSQCVSHVQEEEKLIQSELASIKEQVSSPNTSMVWFLRLFPFGVVQEIRLFSSAPKIIAHIFRQRQMKELMVRAIYCEMLGYDASFSYIHAIKLAQQGSALEKRVGMFSCN